MAGPQEPKGGHRDQHPPARRQAIGVMPEQGEVVVDVLEHVHHQNEVLAHALDARDERDRAPVMGLFAAFRIARIDADAALGHPPVQQVAREHAGAGSHVEHLAHRLGAEERTHGAALGEVIPVPADRRTERRFFLEIHDPAEAVRPRPAALRAGAYSSDAASLASRGSRDA